MNGTVSYIKQNRINEAIQKRTKMIGIVESINISREDNGEDFEYITVNAPKLLDHLQVFIKTPVGVECNKNASGKKIRFIVLHYDERTGRAMGELA